MSNIFEAVDKFFSSFANYLNYNRYFIIFSALFLFTIFCVIISTSHSYESRLIKAVDMFNNYFLDNPQINEDNLIAFNNRMKSSRVPKQLRKQWQQYVLYREDKASKYMSFENCVATPLKNSTYTRDVQIMNILAYIFAGVCLLLNIYCSYEDRFADILQHCLLCPVLILMVNYLVTIFFNIKHNAIISDLYSNYQYFEVNIDKATETLPDYVDYEVLFDKNEIKRGIPILYAYLQKRAEEEKKELERARLRNVEHEKFNFDEAGVERSLVLERAMTEAENYIAERKKLMQDMEQVNNEIYQEENAFRETTKEYQRQMQVSKETFENFKQQLEEVTSSIEANYLKKQQQQELDRQRNLERDYDTATDRHKKVLETYQAEIADLENQIKKARNVLEKSMMSEFDTYSGKVYDEALRVVEERESDKYTKVQDNIKNLEEKLKHKEQEVNGLYDENEQLKEQISTIDADYQQKIQEREQIISRVSDEVNRATGKNKKSKQEKVEQQPAEQQPAGQEQQPEQYDNYNYADNNYDNNQQYDGNQQYDENANYYDDQNQAEQAPADEHIDQVYSFDDQSNNEQAEQPEQQPAEKNNVDQQNYTFNYLDEEQQSPKQEEQPQDANYNFNYLDDEDDANKVKPELEQVNTQDQQQSEQPADSGENAEENSTEQNAVDESTVQMEESKPKGKPGRPRKIVTEPVEKKKPGRPRKVVAEEVATKPTGKRGRPRKEQPEQVEQQPVKKSVGRPKKVVEPVESTESTTEVKPTGKRGRPKKVEAEVEQPAKRKAGRPRKVVAEEVATKPAGKRGRPRKEQPEQVEQQPVKKSVGRPKKVAEPVESTESTTEVKPAGKRGRPKKVEAEVEQPAKKSVGRPKKQVEEKQETKPIGRPKKELKPTEINDIDAFLKEIDDEIAKENAKLEASKIQLAKNAKIKNKKRK